MRVQQNGKPDAGPAAGQDEKRADVQPEGQPEGRPAREAGSPGGCLVVALPTDQSALRSPAGKADRRLLDRRIQAAIGSQLRMLYNDVATEPVPDRLLKLLDQLEAEAEKS